jgi:hypothetical protein
VAGCLQPTQGPARLRHSHGVQLDDPVAPQLLQELPTPFAVYITANSDAADPRALSAWRAAQPWRPTSGALQSGERAAAEFAALLG